MLENTNIISLPYANEVLWGLAFAPCKTQAFTILFERGVAGQLMQLERSQDYANKGMIQLMMYKSCRVSMSVLEQARLITTSAYHL